MDPGPRETAGTTICLIVRYVRHHAGDDGVARLLTRTALDLGLPGRDPAYGAGLVRADAALGVAVP